MLGLARFRGHVVSRDGVLFEVYGAAMAKASLNSCGVVEAFNVGEESGPQRCSSRPGGSLMVPGELAFDSGKERLDDGVVVAAANSTERLIQLEFSEPGGERQGGIERATIGMVHHAAVWSTPRERHHQSVADKLGVTAGPIAQPTTRRDHRSRTAAR